MKKMFSNIINDWFLNAKYHFLPNNWKYGGSDQHFTFDMMILFVEWLTMDKLNSSSLKIKSLTKKDWHIISVVNLAFTQK